MRIALFGKNFDVVYYDAIQSLLQKLEARNHELVIFDGLAGFITTALSYSCRSTFSNSADLKGVDLMIGIGGDGTILNTLLYVQNTDIPVLGLNTGRLGFLSTVSTDEIDTVVDAIESGSYAVEKRSVLELKSQGNLFAPNNFALNEVAVHKNDISAMITISAFVDGVYINSYWADGLIISTATGSTAYSMSCGGPIVMPGTQTFVITPIAPHNLNIRPLVVPDTSTIRLVVEGRERQHLVSLDSRSISLEQPQSLEICKAPFSMHLLRVKEEDFIQTIRQKLMWGIDKRN